eukprot:m.177370 g.177370  ORF g.177370 m.177370 type:complete len:735 (+) comp17963_c1_seq2:410-2614(+)
MSTRSKLAKLSATDGGRDAQPSNPPSKGMFAATSTERILTRVSWEERDLAPRTAAEVTRDHRFFAARPSTAPARNHRPELRSQSTQQFAATSASSSRPKTAAVSASFHPKLHEHGEQSFEEDWLSDLDESDADTDDEWSLTAEELFEPERLARRYDKECKRLGCVPVTYLKRHFGDSVITMNHHGLGPKGTQAVAAVLRGSPVLKGLVLRGNFIESSGTAALCAALVECSQLKAIDLSENQMGAEGIDAVAAMLSSECVVSHVTLEGNQFLDINAPCLAEAVKESIEVAVLQLADNRFGDVAAVHFGTMLAGNQSLEELDLTWNCIRAKGGVALGRGLAANSTLLRLFLSHNGLADKGVAGIASGLASNSSLLELLLEHNRVSTEGAKAIARALATNTSLVSLSLAFNPIGSEGMKAIFEALDSNPGSKLSSLNIDGIVLSADNKKRLQDLVKGRPELAVKVLGVTHNAAERERLMEQLREMAKKYPDRSSPGGASGRLGYDPSWTEEEAWENGFNPDGTPRDDDEWLRHLAMQQPFDPLWTTEEAALHGYRPDGTRMLAAADKPEKPASRKSVMFHQADISSDSESSEYDSDDPSVPHRKNRRMLRRRDRHLRRQFRASYPDLADPMAVLEDYVAEHRLRLVDLFFSMDKNRDGTITEEEIIHAIDEFDLDLNEVQLEALIERMDVDGDGELNYAELCEGRRQFAEKQHRADPRWTTMSPEDDDDSDEGDDDD